ncbi:MAG: hypothetical protein M0O96_06640 [Desulforhopalus sp.]|nr:hypothetical protein [Desulforhopalus sp.]
MKFKNGPQERGRTLQDVTGRKPQAGKVQWGDYREARIPDLKMRVLSPGKGSGTFRGKRTS